VDTFERYRLGVALAGLVLGLLPALGDLVGPEWLRRRAIGLTVATAALLAALEGPLRPLAAALAVAACTTRGDDRGRAHPLGSVAHLLAVASLGGVWVSVPDVEPALAAAGCLLPITVARLVRRTTPGRLESLLLATAVVGAAVVGSAGRATALAAAATVGMVAAAPLVVGWSRRLTAGGVMVLCAVHLLSAVPVGRLVMRAGAPSALAVAAGSFVIQLGAAAAVARLVGTSGPEGGPRRT
jgi:hypothetical protein